MLSNVTYESLSGTNVARDFVELPSQLYEHWLEVPEVLAEFATHAETGEPMPQDDAGQGAGRGGRSTWDFRRWNMWPRLWWIWRFHEGHATR